MLFAIKVGQASGHKPSSNIFKSHGRAMVQFQTINVFFNGYQREIKIQSILNDVFQFHFRYFFAYELPETRVWGSLLRELDDTCYAMQDEWF